MAYMSMCCSPKHDVFHLLSFMHCDNGEDYPNKWL